MDVQSLSHMQFPPFADPIHHRGLFPLDWVVVVSHMLYDGRLPEFSLVACILMLLDQCLPPPPCLSNILFPTAAWNSIPTDESSAWIL